jgi:heme O synthase-like polyprenyltransferase
VISANTFNHIIEAKLDLRMVRTSTRPLPSGTFGILSRFPLCCVCVCMCVVCVCVCVCARARTSCGLLLTHQPLAHPQDE